MESAPSGARVGCAYFGFLDTDLVKAAFAQPSAEAMTGSLPGFIRNPAPLSKAIDAIELRRRTALGAGLGAALAGTDAGGPRDHAAAERTEHAAQQRQARRDGPAGRRLERGTSSRTRCSASPHRRWTTLDAAGAPEALPTPPGRTPRSRRQHRQAQQRRHRGRQRPGNVPAPPRDARVERVARLLVRCSGARRSRGASARPRRSADRGGSGSPASSAGSPPGTARRRGRTSA